MVDQLNLYTLFSSKWDTQRVILKVEVEKYYNKLQIIINQPVWNKMREDKIGDSSSDSNGQWNAMLLLITVSLWIKSNWMNYMLKYLIYLSSNNT